MVLFSLIPIIQQSGHTPKFTKGSLKQEAQNMEIRKIVNNTDAYYSKNRKTERNLIIFVPLICIFFFLYNEKETGYSPGQALKNFDRKLDERVTLICSQKCKISLHAHVLQKAGTEKLNLPYMRVWKQLFYEDFSLLSAVIIGNC